MKSQIGVIRKAKGLMQKYVAQQVRSSHQQLNDFENNRDYP
ncbi:helix-turn-helix transcriptional regulator [Niallia sp. FSL W8-0951]|jgi:transcriptional regulator with XRE-family HTH domain|nr:helix-turn-helix transcriptional regulator [Niallia circulans]MED5101044.1 helix-turn-helix transcriptional regulator [Niallia circulans]